MRKSIIKITEAQLVKLIQENIDEMSLSYDDLKGSDRLEALRNAIKNNKTVSVAFVKKDGSVRHMAFRRTLKSHVFSDRPKTEKQLNVNENNNIYKVIDINKYIQKKKELLANGVDIESAQRDAAAQAWRVINLQTVLGFLSGGNFYDLRDENDILNKFGQDIYDTLTKSMVRSMNQEVINLTDEDEIE